MCFTPRKSQCFQFWRLRTKRLNLIFLQIWLFSAAGRQKKYSSLILQIISVDPSFLGDVGASITAPRTISVLSYCPLHHHIPWQLLLSLLQRTQMKWLTYFWNGDSVCFFTVYLVAWRALSILLLVFLPFCAFGISLIPFVSLHTFLFVLRAAFSIVSVYFPLFKHLLQSNFLLLL